MLLEGAADDDAYGQVHHIAPGDKGLELLDEGSHKQKASFLFLEALTEGAAGEGGGEGGKPLPRSYPETLAAQGFPGADRSGAISRGENDPKPGAGMRCPLETGKTNRYIP